MSRRKRNDDPLAPLAVIDRLEVGPVRLEPRRLIAPYAVHQAGKTESTELIYRFEEDVFDPDDAGSRNLAAMMAVQAAVNYGLFCREIVLRGPFDAADRHFLEEAFRNTAREIYVKKFLEPNVFIRGEAAKLEPVRLDHYCRAALVFPDAAESPKKPRPWTTDSARHAVLSSGGKDSLLSFGLLREIGAETHPIFVNESGRHWFTALNAHRHFEANVPHTARVWTNADRLFAWMLRRLPFVRPDFAQVRADKYPIRLWTVAVFLFGALPLMRKRGVGRLVVGDEFDTTVRLQYKGITHYDGLYDQSRYFDNAMSRYFARKRWGVAQFSLVRPLSELLIEKALVERYPDLQRHQVSCHATHTEGERVYPCGQCEKCRRIAAMLSALGADPTPCGYKRPQIERCLAEFARKGVAQETEGAEHAAFLLERRGLLPPESVVAPRPHPEILKLRFDSRRAPFDAIPNDLRRPLYKLLLQHAEGAVQFAGRHWTPCDPLSPDSLGRPFPFQQNPPDGGDRRAETTFLLGEMTWPQAREYFKKVDIALLPVGAIEQHGHHLPLDTDAFDAEYLAMQVAASCSAPRPIVLPAIPYGVSYHHDEFAGTISIGNETLARLVYEIGMSAARNGIAKLVVVNGHGGNVPTLKFAAQMINRDAHIFTCVDTGETSDFDIERLTETVNDAHAGEVETSTTLAVRPHLVDMKRAKRDVPKFSSHYLNFSSKRSVEWFAHTEKISTSGVIGDATCASREKGEKIWAVMVERLTEFVEELKGMSLDEIYQKRY